MVTHRIELKRLAAKEIDTIQKLAGQASYRVRQGPYCIVYTIEDDLLVVTVVKVGHLFLIF